jgi:hypothetical protein
MKPWPGSADADAGGGGHGHRADRVRALLPRREHAALFLAEPQTGSPVACREETEARTRQSLATGGPGHHEAIIEARHNPETARSLFALASYGRRDPESWNVAATFAKEGIHRIFCHITSLMDPLHVLDRMTG